MDEIKVGDKIRIIRMINVNSEIIPEEKEYAGKEGIVMAINHIFDDIELRGTWGSLPVYLSSDQIEKIN